MRECLNELRILLELDLAIFEVFGVQCSMFSF